MSAGLRRWANIGAATARRRLSAALLLGIALTGLIATSAVGCVGGRLVGLDAEVPPGVAFTGTVVKRVEPFSLWEMSSLDPIAWTFVVDDVQDGQASTRITVTSPRMDASCGIQFELGQRYRVNAVMGSGGALEVISGDAHAIEPLAHPPRVEGSFDAALEWSPLLVALALMVALAMAVVAFGASPRRTPSSDGDHP
jgi:hypothetical protein